MSNRKVTLDGQVLHGRDRYGSWRTRDIDGWFKTPAIKGETAERPDSDGEYDLAIEYTARSMVLSGRVVCSSISAAADVRNRINGLISGRSGKLQVTDAAGQTLTATVKRNGQFDTVLRGNMVTFSLELKAVDPRKYGEDNLFTIPSLVSTSVNHRGNTPAFPEFVVAGSMPGGYTITVGGSQFKVTVPLVSGVSHAITFSDGRLRIRGDVVHGGVGTAETPGIAAGTIPTVYLEPMTTGSGTAFLTLTDTFI